MSELLEKSSDFYYGCCVYEFSEVSMLNGIKKYACNVKIGDIVMTPQGPSKVNFIIETHIEEPTELVKIDDLIITPTHPIYHLGKWILPKDILNSVFVICESEDRLYSFGLENHHVMYINNKEVICIGHGIKDALLMNNYLGSRQIIKDFNPYKDYDGIVRIRSSDFLINKKTGRVEINPLFYIRKKSQEEEICLQLALFDYLN